MSVPLTVCRGGDVAQLRATLVDIGVVLDEASRPGHDLTSRPDPACAVRVRDPNGTYLPAAGDEVFA
ncbi:hypothetical protein [Burkholderia arboris]|uniref:hypothetical protein n=1 Tax=Burkholderia arboris TaxID=488730 RepID=UPI001CA38BE8|nr:hypothetical protein [Burkholderia arboris]MBY8603349.1 hypothetical protein [Burkholderia arboris]MCA8051697.1 hypothetical protein [Burkholderia arboris]